MSALLAWHARLASRGAQPSRSWRSGRMAVVLGAIALSVCIADDAMAGGVEMIVGGTRAAAQAETSAARGVVLTFGIADAPLPLRADVPRRVEAKGRTNGRMTALAPLVAEIARSHRLDPALLMAVIHAESAGDPLAISPKGATGLMQLMPSTGEKYGAADLLDARQNIAAGARFLRELLKRYGSRDLALAAYNAGAGAVDRYGGRIPPYDETQRYVLKVNGLYAHYALANDASRREDIAIATGGEVAIVPAKWAGMAQ
ncbi:lytic transglycosylase domain-containing protein [Burkholderia orbicola]|uniref:Lytic transglycosylase domain-containing protein n=1 Tax=Burkholderia orbicola TaxID=2978683 RepID=A0ABT8P338_9BURK|nr:lytic transglycosylase domain-containing protein [Burkholderia orbicola]MDN7528220.1 lytic transglycosylase domain-containing protein [Burkholderia orbicola]